MPRFIRRWAILSAVQIALQLLALYFVLTGDAASWFAKPKAAA